MFAQGPSVTAASRGHTGESAVFRDTVIDDPTTDLRPAVSVPGRPAAGHAGRRR